MLQQATEDPAGLLEELGDEGSFIDEVQRAPGLMLAIKAVVDQDQRHGRYLVSGSNQPRIRGAVGDSLLGRAAYRTLRPLTISELRLSDDHPGWSFLFQEDEGAVLRELERRATESGALDWATATAPVAFQEPSPLQSTTECGCSMTTYEHLRVETLEKSWEWNPVSDLNHSSASWRCGPAKYSMSLAWPMIWDYPLPPCDVGRMRFPVAI